MTTDPPLRVFTRLVAVAAALEPLLAAARPVAPVKVDLSKAVGLVSAERVLAPAALPSGTIALRDGLAVRAADCAEALPYAPLLLRQKPPTIRMGEALPPGCDAVLPPSALTAAGPFFELSEAVAPGTGVRLPGHDLAAGTVLISAGDVLGAQAQLVLGLAGFRSFAALRPRVAIMHAGAAGIAGYLETIIASLGCEVVHESTGADLVLLLDDGSDIAPVVIPTRGIALRPGETAGTGFLAHVPAILVPAQVEGAIAALYALVLPLIARLTRRVMALEAHILTQKVNSSLGNTEIIVLSSNENGWRPLAAGSLHLDAVLGMEAFALIEPGSEGYAAGTILSATPLRRPLIRDNSQWP